jgi:multiple sugar transport system permease protein
MTPAGMIRKALLISVLVLFAAVFALPYLFMITNSFEEFSYVLPYPPKIFPTQINFAAYSHVLTQSALPRSAFNSVVITVCTALFTVMISSLSAYGFARIDFIGRETLFRVYLFTLMLPGFLSIIPQFLVLQRLSFPGLAGGLVGTKAGLILLYVGTGVCGNTFFLRGSFAALPAELEDSVRVDGGGNMTAFFHVMLPLALPAIATLAIFCLQGTWEEFFTAKIILGGVADNITLPVMIQNLRGQHATRWEWIFAASILAQIPMIALFVVFQKRFVVSGIAQGAVKG